MRSIAVAAFLLFSVTAQAAEPRWGTAPTSSPAYAPQKVLYDLLSGDPAHMANILDRVSMLQNLYKADPFDASIVVIIHGDTIPAFALKNVKTHEALMTRAASLVQSGVIKFRMCGASAKIRGFKAEDIHGFVTMVPMADAEIVRLQHDGYAYMQ